MIDGLAVGVRLKCGKLFVRLDLLDVKTTVCIEANELQWRRGELLLFVVGEMLVAEYGVLGASLGVL